MYLEQVETLAQGTRLLEVSAGYKNCAVPGSYAARLFGGHMICPGCQRLCLLPLEPRFLAGDRFIVRKRPKTPASER